MYAAYQLKPASLAFSPDRHSAPDQAPQAARLRSFFSIRGPMDPAMLSERPQDGATPPAVQRRSYFSIRDQAGLEPNRTGIPTALKAQYEAASGISLRDVQVHYNSEKPAQLQALAYTQGTQVYVGPGQERHLPHELGHVVQQMQGLVKPTGSIGGVPVNTDQTLERQADQAPVVQRLAGAGSQTGTVQLLLDPAHLNVVGERHDESEGRMAAEREFCFEETHSHNYWRENELRYQPVPTPPPAAVTAGAQPAGQASAAAQPVQPTSPLVDPFLGRIDQALGYLGKYTSKKMEVYLVLNGFERSLKPDTPLLAGQDRQLLNGMLNNLGQYLSDMKKGNDGLEFRKIQRDTIAATLDLDKNLPLIAQWFQFNNDPDINVQEQALRNVAAAITDLRKRRLLLANKERDFKPYHIRKGSRAKKLTKAERGDFFKEDVVRIDRSLDMVLAASMLSGTPGVWKIGYKHIEDFKHPEYYPGVQIDLNFSLIEREDFNTALERWETEKLARLAAASPPPVAEQTPPPASPAPVPVPAEQQAVPKPEPTGQPSDA